MKNFLAVGVLVAIGVLGGLPNLHPAYAQTAVSQGLLAHWTFDQGTIQGSQVQDSSGQGRHGTNLGATQVGNCLSFDGNDDRVVVPNFDRQTFSWASWVRKDDSGKGYPPLMVSVNSLGWGIGYLTAFNDRLVNNGWPNNINPTGPGRLYLSHTEGQLLRYTDRNVGSGEFHHLAVSYDGSQVKLYVDGVLDSTQTYSQVFNGGGSYQLGYRLTTPQSPIHPYEGAFKGLMDDMRMYNRVLSGAEVGILAGQGPNCEVQVKSNPQCSDAIDNDGDGKIDYPADLGCENPADNDERDKPECSDGRDNDGDGKIDAADPGCHTDGNPTDGDDTYNPDDDDERDQKKPQCSDKKDNDGDNKEDAADPGCHTDGNPNNDDSYDSEDDDERDVKKVVKAAVITPQLVVPVQVTAKTGAGMGAMMISLLGAAGLGISRRLFS